MCTCDKSRRAALQRLEALSAAMIGSIRGVTSTQLARWYREPNHVVSRFGVRLRRDPGDRRLYCTTHVRGAEAGARVWPPRAADYRSPLRRPARGLPGARLLRPR